jgi:hypothetical protein
VVLPKKDEKIQNSRSVSFGKCEVVGVTYTLKNSTKSAITVENDVDPHERWRGSMNPSFFIEHSLRDSGAFDIEKSDKYPHRYYLEYKRHVTDYKNVLQRSTLIISLLTLGIVPGWGDGTYYISLSVYDADGKLLKSYESQKIEYIFLHGLVFLPFNYHANTLAKVGEDYLSILTDELTQKMISDGLVKCSKAVDSI